MKALVVLGAAALAAPLWSVLARDDAARPAPAGRLAPAAPDDVVVSVERSDDVWWCTVRCESAPVHRVIGALAGALGLDVEGFDAATRAAFVTVDLENRRLAQVLEYVLAGVGLRAEVRTHAIVVAPFALEAQEPEQLLDLALVAYLKAGAAFPSHPLGAQARLSQGRIEERRGNLGAALGHYEHVLESYGTSPLVPRAMLATAQTLERMGLYAQAREQFKELANLDVAHEHQSDAWMGMIRATNAMQDWQLALSMIAAADNEHPSRDRTEARDRLFERARALVGLGEHVEALSVLDEVDRRGMRTDQRDDSFALRASAFEGLDMLAEAGTSWLIYARRVDGTERARALEAAARLALEAEDEVRVLMLAEQARAWELGERLEPFTTEAKRRLGMLGDMAPSALDPLQRLRHAERCVEEDRFDEAARALESLFAQRDQLDDDATARVYRVRALILEHVSGLEPAIELLRSKRPTLERPENRSRLDVVAAGLYEKHERFDDAVEAYGGVYR